MNIHVNMTVKLDGRISTDVQSAGHISEKFWEGLRNEHTCKYDGKTKAFGSLMSFQVP